MYATGNYGIYVEDEGTVYQNLTCGGKIMKEYIYVLYSDLDLNYARPGIYYPQLDLYQDVDPITLNNSNENFYCIGE
jgi:hypothetical protein